eukprot:s3466_g8.t1
MGASACSRARVETVSSNDVEIKDGQGKVLRCISLQSKRPDFLADAIPCATRSLQGSDPTQWAMTNLQLLEFFNYIRSTREYEAAKEARGHVCLYDVNSLFVVPWSRGFGCGVALLMNAHAPLKAQVMISHAWGEDVEELVSSLSSWASRIQLLWASDGADPYDRLWCVHEVDEALDSKLFVTAIGTYSLGGRMFTVCTCRAKCGNPADEERIRAVIESKVGGYERLDRTIRAFRDTLLKSGTSVVAELQVPWNSYCGGVNRFVLNLEGLGLDKVCKELSGFGVGWKELFGLFTLTDSYGCKIPFEPLNVKEDLPVPCLLESNPLRQPLVRRQFPLKLACALEVRHRWRIPRNEVASGSHSIAKVSGTKDCSSSVHRRWNDMKLHHPVLCGQWMSGSLDHEFRVGGEILELLEDATLNADLFRCDFRQRDLSHFIVYLRGARGTPYDSGWFAAEINVPKVYPFNPYKVKISTKILHPNIGAENGEVCLDILSDQWTSALKLSQVVLSVVALLAAPEPQDPMNVEAAALQLNHPELFAEKARLWTRTYALPEPPSFRDLGICTLLSL